MLSHTVSNSYMPVSSFDRSENDGLLLGSASQHRNMREYLPQGWATNHQHENTKTHKQRLCLFFQITEVINGGLKCKLNPYWSRRGASPCVSELGGCLCYHYLWPFGRTHMLMYAAT